MIFSSSISTPSGTTGESPQATDLQVAYGLIYRVEFDFPPGPFGLLHVQVFDGGYQLYPASPGESFATDNRVIAFDDPYLKTQPPWTFRVVTWNLDTRYKHVIHIRVGIAETEAYMSRFMPSIQWKKFSQTMARAAREQAEAREEQFKRVMKQFGG